MPSRVLFVFLGLFLGLGAGFSTSSCAQSAADRPAVKTENTKGLNQAQLLRQKYVEVQKELRFRELSEKFKSRFKDPDLKYLQRTLLPAPNPVLQRMSVDDLVDSLTILETIIIDYVDDTSGLSYYSPNTSDVYIEYPDSPPGVPFVTADDFSGSRSVVAIIQKVAFDTSGGFPYQLNTEPLRMVASTTLCEGDRFFDEPSTLVEGTGFLIQDGQIITAGHVVSENPTWLESVFFVFDYARNPDGSANVDFKPQQIFEGESLQKFQDSGSDIPTKRDWAIIKLKEVPDRDPLILNDAGSILDGAEVYMVGHPNGLPQILSDSAFVVDTTDCRRFKATVDNYTHSSGSPVFNATTHQVEGLLVFDVGNYRECESCLIRTIYTPEYGFAGAEVIRSTEITEWLKHPNSIIVTTEVPAAVVVANGEDFVLSPEFPSVEIPWPGEQKEIFVEAPSCTVVALPNPGERWIVTQHLDGYLTLTHDCFQ